MADGQKNELPVSKSLASDLLREHSGMQAERYNFEAIWQRVADLTSTGEALFQRTTTTQGERRDQMQFDSTGALAMERFAAAMESMLTPRTQKWAQLIPANLELRDDIMVKRWAESVNDILFAQRYRAKSGFTTATGEHYRSLGAYGTGATMVLDDVARGGMMYRAYFLGEIFIATSFQNVIDKVHRKFEYTARQARQAFGDGPNDVYRLAMEKNQDGKFEFLQCIKPNAEYDPGNRQRRMPIASYYVDVNHQEVVQSSGYFSMPLIVSRFNTNPRESYGRSPAITVLNSLNTVNEQAKTMLRAGQRSVDPPLMAMDDDMLRGFNMRSNAINYGALDSQGNERVKPFQTGANMPIGLDMIESERRVINDAFYVTLFQILVENPRMTATEAMLRAQEKGALLAPPMGRQQTEYLGPMIEREIDILIRQGLIPPPPPQLVEAGGEVEIEYTAPLNQLQKSDDAVAVIRTFEAVTPLAQIDPTVLDGFRLPQAAQIIAKANGMPAEALATAEEMQEKDAGRAEAAEAQMLLQAAPVAGKTAKDFAQAQAAGLQAPDVSALLGPQ